MLTFQEYVEMRSVDESLRGAWAGAKNFAVQGTKGLVNTGVGLGKTAVGTGAGILNAARGDWQGSGDSWKTAGRGVKQFGTGVAQLGGLAITPQLAAEKANKGEELGGGMFGLQSKQAPVVPSNNQVADPTQQAPAPTPAPVSPGSRGVSKLQRKAVADDLYQKMKVEPDAQKKAQMIANIEKMGFQVPNKYKARPQVPAGAQAVTPTPQTNRRPMFPPGSRQVPQMAA